MGREFLRVVSIDEALNVILRVAESVSREISAKKEWVHLSEALGRISAADLHAPFDIPPFDRATVDGYAVIAEDTFYAEEDAPAVLSLRGELRAGEVPKVSVQRGTCVAISTGAPMPAGADAVVKVENTELAEKSGSGGSSGGRGGGEQRFVVGAEGEGSEKVKVKIFKPVVPAENVQRAGSDIRKGERILSEGTLLTPRETGLLAACGFSEVLVRKKVKVGVLSTGNEIVSVDHTKLPPGKIYDVNMRTISDAVRLCGCIPVQLGVAPDDFDEIEARLKSAFQQGTSSCGEVDVFVVSGGTSAGAGDIVPAVLERNGEILVHGVDIKPGKPFAFGIFSGKPLFALPGNPTSALLSFSLFVAPFLKRISSASVSGTANERTEEKCMKARTSQRIISEKGRNEFVFVRLERSSGGEMLATPILKGSGAVSTLASADGYIFVEKGREIVEAGETVEIRLLTPNNFPLL